MTHAKWKKKKQIKMWNCPKRAKSMIQLEVCCSTWSTRWDILEAVIFYNPVTEKKAHYLEATFISFSKVRFLQGYHLYSSSSAVFGTQQSILSCVLNTHGYKHLIIFEYVKVWLSITTNKKENSGNVETSIQSVTGRQEAHVMKMWSGIINETIQCVSMSRW